MAAPEELTSERSNITSGQSPEEIVVVGRVQGPYGIQGWVHVATFTDPRDNITGYRPWFLADASNRGIWRPARLAEVRTHKQGFVARFSGIDDRNGAQSLRGCWIGVPESEFSRLPADEYYWRDLIGLKVIDQDGLCLGRVRELLETGVHDVLVVAAETEASDDEGAAEGETVLIPFHRQFVLGVDKARGEISVHWLAADAATDTDQPGGD